MVKAPYAKLVTSTFSTRMSWSPDGSFLATGGRWGQPGCWVRLSAGLAGAVPRAGLRAPSLQGGGTGQCFAVFLIAFAVGPAAPAAGNSYQGSTHAAVVLQRGRWNEEQEHLLVSGHQGEPHLPYPLLFSCLSLLRPGS